MVIAALQWAKRIMGKIDEECEPRNYDAGDKKSHIPGVPKAWGLHRAHLIAVTFQAGIIK
jgi:hypothetical protein